MWYLLATSLAALSFNRYLAYSILALASFIGWTEKVLELPALIFIAIVVIGGALVALKRYDSYQTRYWLEGLCVAIAVALVLHLLPGFNNPKVLDAITAGPQSMPFRM